MCGSQSLTGTRSSFTTRVHTVAACSGVRGGEQDGAAREDDSLLAIRRLPRGLIERQIVIEPLNDILLRPGLALQSFLQLHSLVESPSRVCALDRVRLPCLSDFDSRDGK